MNFGLYSFQLRGHQPLLVHADDIWQADELEAWRKDEKNKNRSRAGDDRSPPWTWQSYLYNDGKHLAMPAANIMVCLRQAGTQLILKKQKTYKELTQSGLLIDGEFCKFFCRGSQIEVTKISALRELPFAEQALAVQKLGFSLYAKRARVGQSKHIRVRPRFDEWSVEGEIAVVTKDISEATLNKLFEIAGGCGLCDWRPACKTPGSFGMFTHALTRIS